MKCKKVRKKLLLFLDRELPEKRMNKVQNHLNGCSDCSKHLDMLSNIWNVSGELERIEPSPYLWNKISLRIAEYDSSQNLFSTFFETIARYAVPATVTVVFLAGILAGIHLGSFPNSQKSKTFGLNSEVSAREKFIRSSYLDSFDSLPSESIGGVCLALTSDKR